MNKPKWLDSIRFRGKVDATQLTSKGLTFAVHHDVHSSPDIWFLSCIGLSINPKQLESRDLETAKLQAIQMISKILEDIVKELAIEAGLNEEISTYADRLGLSGTIR